MSAFAERAQGATTQVPADHATIQAAIDAALLGDEIIVAAGIYWETIDFLGKAITLKSADGPLVTVIDGSQSNGSVVRCVSGEGPLTTIQGFTVTGGSASEVGGGMRNIGTSPTVIDMIFNGNHAGDRGGGMYNRDANPLVIDSLFEGNDADEMGGGMFNLESSPTIIRSRFTANTSNKGGGMRNYINSHPTVTDSIFSYNEAGEEGGGMDNRKNSNPVVTGTIFIGNSAQSSGGGVHNYVGRAIATGNPLFVNNLIIGNFAPSGAGMRNNDVSPTLIATTVADNVGSGISSRQGSAPVLIDSIVYGNTGGSFSGATADLSVVTHSDIEGGYPGIGNVDTDPLFANPAANDYRLAANSPLIDAGLYDARLPEYDLDGNPRLVGDVDMGPYEHAACPDGEVCGPANAPPVASFDWLCADLSCGFQDTSQDGDGFVASWSWSFGDGNGAPDQFPTHDYAAAGTYTVTLEVTDDYGAASFPAAQQVAVGAPAAPINIDTVSPATVGVPSSETVTITGTGFGADAQISLTGAGGPIKVSVTDIQVPTTIVVTITVKSGGPRRPRVYDLTVTSGGSSATLTGGFTVLP